jgi:oxygen-dependent protoporphyrinogen oxidase
MSVTKSVNAVVIGAGISGLVTAYRLQKTGRTVALLETSDRVGGSIRSEWKEGFLLEYGPNTVLPNPALLTLVEELGLQSELLFADPRAPRFVQWKGELLPLPMSASAFLKSKLLTPGGRLRILAEPLIARRRDPSEESLYNFSQRRLGREAADRLVSPFVSGVWAGDSRQLSAEGAFPRMVAAERSKGSLFRGLLAQKKKNGKSGPKGLLSFKDGIESLPRRIAEALGAAVDLNAGPISMQRKENQWQVTSDRQQFDADRIFLAQPAWAAAALMESTSNEAARALRDIPYASLAVLHLAIEQNAVEHLLNGFGYLIAPDENCEILGCLWNSSLFPRRVPTGQCLLTVFVGGSRFPASVEKSDTALFESAFQNINPLLKFRKKPRLLAITRYDRAIPQYTMGHKDRVGILLEIERRFPGIKFAGNYIGGISVGDVVTRATELSA